MGPYVLVHDVPATWERYRGIVESLAERPQGLLVHAAGPTDEGFRIVEVWATEGDWQRFAEHFDAALRLIDPDVAATPVVRDLRARHVLLGPPVRGSPNDQVDVPSPQPGVRQREDEG